MLSERFWGVSGLLPDLLPEVLSPRSSNYNWKAYSNHCSGWGSQLHGHVGRIVLRSQYIKFMSQGLGHYMKISQQKYLWHNFSGGCTHFWHTSDLGTPLGFPNHIKAEASEHVSLEAAKVSRKDVIDATRKFSGKFGVWGGLNTNGKGGAGLARVQS